MSDTTQSEDTRREQPAESASPDATGNEINIDDLTEDQLNAVLFPDEEIESEESEDTPDPSEEPEGDEVTEEPSEPEASHKSIKRVSVRSLPEDQQAIVARAVEMVRSGEAPDIATATARIAGPPTEKPDATSDTDETSETSHPETPTETGDPVAEIQTKIADLRAQRKQAMVDYDAEAQADLTEQIEEAIGELSDAKAIARFAEREQQAQVGNYREKYEATIEVIETLYPDLHDDDSSFSRVFDGMVANARAKNDPALSDPTHLRQIASEVAEILSVTPAGAKPAAAAKPTPVPAPPRRTAANGSAVAPGHTEASRITSDDARRFISTASLEELDALIGE